ncbi:FAD-dependent 5-carboxymethylaminomethyl-2-thiouridine(34) oxidoreductase MnmC, partial [Brevundimonas sp.]|uniref:FAD-dependent 5-carboxymethylaminomethyl-2-thiouridine(34) oxidoreductase MnmC n=1 Tax=Brevundimonas sp. TaxID=1871086 RepID=UPI003D6D67D8
AEHGFVVEKKPGHGKKRERLEAHLPSPAPAAPTDRRVAPHVAIVGAGIAGASVARALIAGGARVTVIEADRPGAGGSGFPAALVTPRLDAGDALIAGFHAQALERARDLYRALPEAVIAEGVLQLEQAPRDATRFDKVAAQDLWPAGAMSRLDAVACADHLGEPVRSGGLRMQGALALRPSAVLEPWLAGAERLTARVAALQPQGGGWRLIDADGQSILDTDAVVLTAGWETAALAPDLPLAPVAGQADWVEGPTTAPVAWGGYAVPTGTGLLFGATHDRGQTDLAPDAEASARNLATLAAALPGLAAQVEAAGAVQTRKAVRATTPDRLPISGPLAEPGLYALTGLGSRGFCVAPLLGEDLAAQILSAPSPLPLTARRRLSPARFTPGERNPAAGWSA